MSSADSTRIILEAMQAALKPLGYRKRGTTFTRKLNDDVLLIVNLQKSRSSDRSLLKVTVNLGVFSLPLARNRSRLGFWVRSLTGPSVWDCHWQERIGALMPRTADQSWEAGSVAEADQVGSEIADALIQYGLPALDQVCSTERLRALWASGQSPGLTQKERLENLAILTDPDQWNQEQEERLQAALERYDERHPE